MTTNEILLMHCKQVIPLTHTRHGSTLPKNCPQQQVTKVLAKTLSNKPWKRSDDGPYLLIAPVNLVFCSVCMKTRIVQPKMPESLSTILMVLLTHVFRS